MQENKKPEKLTNEKEARAATITRIAQNLPEREQEKIYYMMKGFELAGIQNGALPETQADTA